MSLSLLIALALTRAILIPVQFEDLKFACSEENIAQYVKGAQDYFNAQFPSEAQVTIDMAPMVNISAPYSYYGANSGTRHDALIYRCVMEACRQSDAQVDFSLYEQNGGMDVFGVILMVPGPSEAEGAGEMYFWPCQSALSEDNASLYLDGRRIDRYCITNEDGRIGTLCHEFCHLLGLPDFYDTDNGGSGGHSPALYGSTSLMDGGNRNGGYMTPPYLNSIEREMLGLEGRRPLETGTYNLKPLGKGSTFYRFDSPVEGEYFLFECRAAEGYDTHIGGSGLVIYHIDRTDRNTGYSDFYQEELSAARRWELNEINCRPGSECAMLVSADPLAADASGVFFGGPGHGSFSSGSTPSFAFHDGSVSSLALTDIKIESDGSVSFTVTEPLVITGVAGYQDAAIVSWQTRTETDEISYFELSWYSDLDPVNHSEKIGPARDGTQTYTINGLRPGTDYTVVIRVVNKNATTYSQVRTFSTRSLNEKIRPYIYLSDAGRHQDGSFPAGAKLPLRLYNLPNQGVEWFLDRERISVGADGYYTLEKSGTLRAVATLRDGSVQVFMKEVTVR